MILDFLKWINEDWVRFVFPGENAFDAGGRRHC